MRFLFIIICLILNINCYSQTDKRQILFNINGSGSFINNKSFIKKDYNIYISPKVGYFIEKNFALGIGNVFEYSYGDYYYANSQFPERNIKNKYKIMTGPFFRYYIPINRFAFFLHANMYIGSYIKLEESIYGSTDYYKKTSIITNAGVGFGCNYFFNKTVAIEFLPDLQYFNSRSKSGYVSENDKSISGKYNNIDEYFQYGFKIGIQIHFDLASNK